MTTSAADALRQRCRTHVDPAGRRVDAIEEQELRVLADRLECPLRQIYIEALDHAIWPCRYLRNRDSLSIDDQRRLIDARVAVIGAGGLGGSIIQLLARIGIGRLTIVDHDRFDETNLNRQSVSSTGNIGRSKSEETARMVHAVNPMVETTAVQTRLNAANVDGILTGAEVVVDALDNVSDRLVVDDAARRLGLPLVHGAIAGFNGQVTTIFPEDDRLQGLYGSAPHRDDPRRPEAVLGVPAVTPWVVAGFEAMEVVKILLNRGEILRRRLLHLDLENAQLNVFHL